MEARERDGFVLASERANDRLQQPVMAGVRDACSALGDSPMTEQGRRRVLAAYDRVADAMYGVKRGDPESSLLKVVVGLSLEARAAVFGRNVALVERRLRDAPEVLAKIQEGAG